MTNNSTQSARLPRREFARALRLGLGRARIDVRRHGLAGREDLLVAVCLRNPTRDPQLEGGIEGWLLDVARDGGVTALVRREILAAASRPIGRRADRVQIASFLARWALDGDRVAARALLRMIEIQVPCERFACSALWGFGEEAWRRVIRSYGRRWAQAGRFDWGWIVDSARRELGPRRMIAALRSEVDRDPAFRPLADCVEQESSRQARSNRPERAVDASLAGLERLVGLPGRREGYFELSRWTKAASAADRAESWRRLLAETDARRLVRRLWAWRYRKPPAAHPRLFELAQHASRLVRFNASDLLGKFRSARVRALALRLLRNDPAWALDGDVLELFELNATDEDAVLIDAALARRASREARNSWASAVRQLARTRPSPVWTPLLVRAMEVTPCRHCRGSALRLLVERGAAEDAVLREALFDADADTRQIARDALAARRRARLAPRR